MQIMLGLYTLKRFYKDDMPKLSLNFADNGDKFHDTLHIQVNR